jgi:hypothetical protein
MVLKMSYKLRLGFSNTAKRESNDFYATPSRITENLLELESFHNVLEPACGTGHISEVLKNKGIKVKSSDLIDRAYGEIIDFFEYDLWEGDIITNPPYKYAQNFVEHALRIVKNDAKVAMFLKVLFLEGQTKKKMFFY